ncbi:hypothetical protein [Paenibacillus sp. NFR01]|uniref:hypothetical protein n=1 Tax=Paenibacillus sp. NFR01 TaxID=1566279 RepID=UPI0008B1B838|nr:hypothetical protein [Paenibacillus sp. NFR01]SEU29054.1 hypothetical protein SAMN03159358_4739 [Paenibacillus sp. NFR01]
MNESEDLERKLSELLEEGELDEGDRRKRELARVSPKYEIRISTRFDPVAEETRKYREIAEELDDRYDKYLKRTEE